VPADRSSRRIGERGAKDQRWIPDQATSRARRLTPLGVGALLVLGSLGVGAAPAFASGGSTVTVPPPSTQTKTVSISASGTTGAAQTFTVPAGVSQVTFTLKGGAGGSGAGASLLITASGGGGGSGEVVTGTLPVTTGEQLELEAGGQGGNATASKPTTLFDVCTAAGNNVSSPGTGGGVGTPSTSALPLPAGVSGSALSGGSGGYSEPQSSGYASVDNCEPGAGGGGGAASFLLAERSGSSSAFAAIAAAGGGGGGAGSSDGNNGGAGGGWGSGSPGNGGNGGGTGSAGSGGQGGAGGTSTGGDGGGKCSALVPSLCFAPTGGGGGGGGGGYDPVTGNTNGDGGQGGAYVGVQGGGGGGAGGGFCPTSSTPSTYNPLGATCMVAGQQSGPGSAKLSYTATTPGIALASPSGTNQVSATYDTSGTPVPLELELSTPTGSATPTGSVDMILLDTQFPSNAIPLGSVPLGGSSRNGSSTFQSCSSASGGFQTCTWDLTVDVPGFFAPISGVSYSLEAYYQGDSSLAPTGDSDPVSLQLSLPQPPPSTSPTTTVTLSAPGSVDAGQPVTVTAQVSASSGGTVTSGTVQFSFGLLNALIPPLPGQSLTPLECDGKTSVAVSNGTATCTTRFDVEGQVVLEATFTPPSGSSLPKAQSAPRTLVVVVPTTTTLDASTTTPLVGQAVTLAATVSSALGPVPSGSVSFLEAANGSSSFRAVSCGSSTTVSVSNGQATCALTLSRPGTVLVRASFEPPSGTTFQPSTSATLALTAQAPPVTPGTPPAPLPTTTAVQVVSPATPPYRPGSPVGLQATVSATGSQAPSGTVTFTAVDAAGTSTVLCSAVPLSPGSAGSATADCTASFAASGPETIQASYQPASSTWAASSGSTSLVVAIVPVVQLVPATASPMVGQIDVLTATVLTPGGQPVTSGSVTITASQGTSQQVLCADQPVSGAGQVACPGTFATAGSVVVTAAYLGSGDSVLPGSATTTVTVQAAPVTLASQGATPTSGSTSPSTTAAATSATGSTGAPAPLTSPSSGTSAPSTTSGSAVVVPSVHTGEPWSGSWWWVAAGSLAGVGLALVAWGSRRRLARRTG
jgi:hypothetical protein